MNESNKFENIIDWLLNTLQWISINNQQKETNEHISVFLHTCNLLKHIIESFLSNIIMVSSTKPIGVKSLQLIRLC